METVFGCCIAERSVLKARTFCFFYFIETVARERSPPLFLNIWSNENSETEESLMAEQKEFKIKVAGELVEVSEEVYLAYYRMERRERFLAEQDIKHGIFFYSALDQEGILGEDRLTVPDAQSVEDMAILHIMGEQLHHYLESLTEGERRLVYEIYFTGRTEREYAQMIGISQAAVFKRKHKILKKLYGMMEKNL